MNERSGRAARHNSIGTGSYIALFLVAAALAAAGYRMLLPGRTAVPPVQEDDPPPAAVLPLSDVPGAAPDAMSSPAPGPASGPEPEPPVEPAVSEPAAPVQAPVQLIVPDEPVVPDPPRLIVPPLAGETVAVFSVEYPVYNETLGDWRTHDGVDLAAPLGTQVLAACSGTVREVRRDDLMGTLVVLDHGDGYETVYAGLQEQPPVAAAESVSAGQVIGAVGDTALAESASGPHLHFAVLRDGEPVDPEAFLNS